MICGCIVRVSKGGAIITNVNWSVFENIDFSISCNSDICHYYDTVHCSRLTSYVISLTVRVLCRMSSHAAKMR